MSNQTDKQKSSHENNKNNEYIHKEYEGVSV